MTITTKHLRHDAMGDRFTMYPACGDRSLDAWVEPDFNDVTCVLCLQVYIGNLQGTLMAVQAERHTEGSDE